MLIVLPVASTLAKDGDVGSVIETFRKLYPELLIGNTVRNEKEAEKESEGNDVLGLIVTGGTEQIMGAIKKSARSFSAVYHDSLNSMPAVLEASSAFGFMSFYINDEGGIRSYAKAVEIAGEMQSEKLLLIGDPSPWLVYSGYAQNPEGLIKGYEKQNVERLIELSGSVYISDEEVSAVMSRAETEGPSPEDFRTSLKIEKAIKKMLEERGARFFAIKCFDILEPLKGTACLALSRLNDAGYVAVCEGDISAALSMLLLSKASGLPSFMGNVAKIDGKTLLLAHCTSPTKILSGFKYMSHFESGLGVGIAGEMKEGERVTVARLDTKKKILRAGSGKVLSQPFRGDLCRTQVKVELEDPSTIARSPIGNHYALTLGNHVKLLESFAYVEGYSFEKI